MDIINISFHYKICGEEQISPDNSKDNGDHPDNETIKINESGYGIATLKFNKKVNDWKKTLEHKNWKNWIKEAIHQKKFSTKKVNDVTIHLYDINYKDPFFAIDDECGILKLHITIELEKKINPQKSKNSSKSKNSQKFERIS